VAGLGGKRFTQITSVKVFCIKKFGQFGARETFSNLGLNGVEKCAYSTEYWPYLGNGEIWGQF